MVIRKLAGMITESFSELGCAAPSKSTLLRCRPNQASLNQPPILLLIGLNTSNGVAEVVADRQGD